MHDVIIDLDLQNYTAKEIVDLVEANIITIDEVIDAQSDDFVMCNKLLTYAFTKFSLIS